MKTSGIEISIIIPCYNVMENYIRRVLDSIQAQSYSNYETIIVDDGSMPEYHVVLERVICEYDKTTLITTKNNGVSKARNIGVENAKGNYIAFVDADDYILPDFLREAYDAFVDTGADLVIGGTKYIENGDYRPPAGTYCIPEYMIYRSEQIRELYCSLGCLRQTIRFGDSYVSRGPVSRVVKKSIAEITPFHTDLIVGEDIVWNLEILSHCTCVCLVKSQWYCYWKNPASALHRYNPTMLEEVEKAIIAIESLMNLEDDKEYMTFHYYIFDSIHTVRQSILSYSSPSNRTLILKTKKAIYTREPWIRIKEQRFFNIASIKYKLLYLLYRLHLLLLFWSLRDN